MAEVASHPAFTFAACWQNPGGMWIMAGLCVGLAMGSFIATLAVRWPAGLSLAGRSRCDQCGHRLGVAELIPLLSYLLQRGRCRQCGSAIDWRHPSTELAATAIGGVALLAIPGPAGFVAAGFGWTLLALVLLDSDHHWLPDALTLPLLGAGLLLGPGLLTDRLLGAAIAGGTLLAVALTYRGLRGREGLGMGDVKLAAGLGAWVSMPLLPLLLLLATLVAFVALGLARLRGARLDATTRLPFGACLAVAGFPLHLLSVQPGWGSMAP